MTETKLPVLPPFRLRSIYVRRSEAKMTSEFDPLIGNQELAGQFKASPLEAIVTEITTPGSSEVPQRSVSFVTSFEFVYRLTIPAGRSRPEKLSTGDFVASLSADFAVDYIIDGNQEMPQELLAEWGRGPALMQSWPYWREHCHSMMMKMSLPTTVLPMMVARPREQISAAAAAKPDVQPKPLSSRKTLKAKLAR